MKRLIFLMCFVPLCLKSQVIIGAGKSNITNNSVALEFGNEPKGIIVPWVSTATSVTGAVPGTFIFDSSDAKVKVKLANVWQDLSIDKSGISDLTLQTKYVENTNAKVTIGKPSSTPGILVLEDTNKAMILPSVSSYKDVKSPSAGMIVFDTTTKFLCVFNGKVWSFWKG